MRTRNAQISDGAGWAARWRIPDPYVDLLDNVYELTSGTPTSINVASGWVDYAK
jgi:hypothetical protein